MSNSISAAVDTATATKTAARIHHSNAPQGTEQTHTIIIELVDRPGSVDRVVGMLRRRRSRMQSLSLAPAIQDESIRITARVQDAEVVIDHLVEQIRKIVDVTHVENLDIQQSLVREIALIQVDVTTSDVTTVRAAVQQFAATVIDATPQTVTFEVIGSGEQVEQSIAALQPFGIREIARSGSVAVARASAAS